MLIKCEEGINDENYARLIQEVEKHGLKVDKLSRLEGISIWLGVRGDCTKLSTQEFSKLPGVEEVQRVSTKYKLSGRQYHPVSTVVNVGGVSIGEGHPTVFMAGPCAVESEEQILRIAKEVKDQGAIILRGGAWKPRTSPGYFEGLKEKGLEYLAKARGETGLPVVTEVMSSRDVELIGNYTDIFQVGARNMQNFDLLDELGKTNKPVLLKRGTDADIDVFLAAADRILYGGNKNVLLCLRGITTFDRSQRYTADLYAIPDLKRKSHLPIIFDPSHPAGRRDYVPSLARMAIAGGVDGLIIETHYCPSEALCDGAQMILPKDLGELVSFARNIEREVRRIK